MPTLSCVNIFDMACDNFSPTFPKSLSTLYSLIGWPGKRWTCWTICCRARPAPTTGRAVRDRHRWALEARSDAHLELVDSTYIAAPGTAAGRAGRHVWNFKVRQAGDVRLALKLWRAWEGDKSIADRFDVTIVSRP